MLKKLTCITLIVLAAVSSLFFTACPQTPEKQIEISVVGWIIENIDSSYWFGNAPASNCFIDFDLQYTGDPIELADIDKVYIKKDDAKWELTLNAYSFSAKDHIILSSMERLSYNYYIDNSLPIGTYDFEVKLTNGYSAFTSFTVPAPGSTTTQGFSYVYTEDLHFTPPPEYTPLLKRAIINSGARTSNTVTVDFSSADTLFYSGFLVFYSAAGETIGISTEFRDYYNGTINTICNGGNVLYNNGTNNQIMVNAANINFFYSNNTIADIAGFGVILTDGMQYAGTHSTYDCRSYSAIYAFS